MSLQKKCLTASAITHGLLLLLVFVGSAFIPPKPKPPEVEIQLFDIITDDFHLVAEDGVMSGGNPDARKGNPTPQPAPQQPAPTPQPQQPKTQNIPVAQPPEPKPEQKVEPVKQPEKAKDQVVQEKPKPKIDPDDFKISEKKVVKKPEPKKEETLSLKDILSKAEKRTVTTTQPKGRESDSDSKSNRETQMAANDALNDLKRRLGERSGSPNGSGDVDDILGPGGARVASYSLYLASVYRDAWVPPARSASGVKVRVRVTISRDGVVISSDTIGKSGNRDFDRAADATIARVRRFDRPPPTREPSVTYTIEFVPPN